MSDEPKADPHETCGRKLDDVANRLDDVIGVLQQHARVLERHAGAIDDIGKTMKSVDAGIKLVREAQATQNQLTANLHQMYSRLQCIAPRNGGDDDCPADFERSLTTDEVRQLRLLEVNGDEDG